MRSFKRVGAVDSAVSILRHLADTDRPRTLTQIARELGLNPSTCFNILRTLESRGLIALDVGAKTYAAGEALFDLARRGAGRANEVELLQPVMDAIVAAYGVHISFWSHIDTDHLVLVAVSESNGAERISMTLGQRRPTIYGAMGRVMAAFVKLDDAYLEEHFARLRWVRPITLAAFKKDVRATRKQGWAIDRGFGAVGLDVIAAPVYGRDNSVRGVSCATAFLGENAPEVNQQIAERLMILGDVLRNPYGVQIAPPQTPAKSPTSLASRRPGDGAAIPKRASG